VERNGGGGDGGGADFSAVRIFVFLQRPLLPTPPTLSFSPCSFALWKGGGASGGGDPIALIADVVDVPPSSGVLCECSCTCRRHHSCRRRRLPPPLQPPPPLAAAAATSVDDPSEKSGMLSLSETNPPPRHLIEIPSSAR